MTQGSLKHIACAGKAKWRLEVPRQRIVAARFRCDATDLCRRKRPARLFERVLPAGLNG